MEEPPDRTRDDACNAPVIHRVSKLAQLQDLIDAPQILFNLIPSLDTYLNQNRSANLLKQHAPSWKVVT